ncbi:DUF4882 family protein [Acinetobacter sp. ANC 3882]|uniref:DUF4882 family protein n=1 Tax=Acinetobacter sp. ANC 3882 TaxID=2923423 RepID=UPI001F4B8B87|nr:DUF4882 domain-containing protein [Acinetobacter sp. ANC 3882]
MLFTAVIYHPVFAQCSFSFNATQAQIKQANQEDTTSTILKFPSVNGMKASYTVAANPDMGTKINYYAMNGDGYKFTLPQTGIIAYEYQFKVPTSVISGNGNIVFLPTTGAGDGENQAPFVVMVTYANNFDTTKGQNQIGVGVYNSNVSGGMMGQAFDVTVTPTGYQRLGVYINQDTKQVGVIFNGVNAGYIGIASTKPVNYYFAMNLGQYAIPVGNSVIGQEISQELILDKSQLQFKYPVGTKDICGAVL